MHAAHVSHARTDLFAVHNHRHSGQDGSPRVRLRPRTWSTVVIPRRRAAAATAPHNLRKRTRCDEQRTDRSLSTAGCHHTTERTLVIDAATSCTHPSRLAHRLLPHGTPCLRARFQNSQQGPRFLPSRGTTQGAPHRTTTTHACWVAAWPYLTGSQAEHSHPTPLTVCWIAVISAIMKAIARFQLGLQFGGSLLCSQGSQGSWGHAGHALRAIRFIPCPPTRFACAGGSVAGRRDLANQTETLGI